MTIEQYIEKVSTRLKSGISREHSYRGDLETLIRELVKGVEITNEPANVTDCGNPDYVITKGKIPIGYIEAKDIGKDLNSKSYKEQFDRYKKALDNLIITDYVWFQFFKNGELVHEIRIAEIENDAVKPLSENFTEFTDLIKDFCTHIGQTIKSSKKLAEMMASKARLLQDILERAITSDEESEENTSLRVQYKTFKDILIHNLSPKAFADIYAQTLAYGMFAARLHDETLDDFSRQEAAELIPKSNPFLRKLFAYVAGPDIDDRIVRTVDNLAEVFRATNVEQLLKNFGKSTQTNDPIIHFYETFLAEYDPKLRKAKGVWYTPEPVVNFIVRAVDDILKTEFDLPQGLADTGKTKIKVKDFYKATADRRSKTKIIEIEKEVHKVQILDPATGTGTFLAEVVKYIYSKKFKAMQGAWSSYVDEHLIPRLNGFELLMASYSMAHLKLDMLLHDTGYKATKNQRFNIYLTNSLEEHHPDTGTLFAANWLSIEANEANHIKRDTPVMVVMGNPPYAVSSTNKSEWIQNLLKDYKKDLNERKINLDDDYIKFLRYGEYFIDKTGEGILAYISNNSFIDGITHRQMRKHLLETFDKVYILDLHGNSKKKETAPDGSADQNVFDIMQGVSINIFVKKSKSKKLGQIKHFDAYGKRQNKYDFLNENSISSIDWNKLNYKEPYFFFVPKDFEEEEKYKKGFKVDSLFKTNNSGVSTDRDSLFLSNDLSKLQERIKTLLEKEYSDEFKTLYNVNDSSGYPLLKRISNKQYDKSNIIKYHYRPFDIKYIYFDNTIISRPANKVSNNIINKDNLILIVPRQVNKEYHHTFISKIICDSNITSSARLFGAGKLFPLYLYPDQEEGIFTEKDTSTSSAPNRKPNLNLEIVAQIAKKIGLEFVPEKEEVRTARELSPQSPQQQLSPQEQSLKKEQSPQKQSFAPIDILDYIYAVLHSPTYREKYKEFLKIDFPRVPYPKNKETFWQLVKLGGEIRQIHLLESPKTEEYITSYPIDGDNKITTKIGKKDWEITSTDSSRAIPTVAAIPTAAAVSTDAAADISTGRIWINETQYFDNIPLTAWEFYIGGYQPAQKWLKDRKERTLSFEDILHYQKIIVALSETDKLMKAIDKIEIE